MEHLLINTTGTIRYDSFGGKDYIVAPMSLISPGVLAGSKGPLLYPEEEISNNVDAWNHIPLVVYHPTENGNPVSARTPTVLNRQGIGFIFKAKISNNKLVAEGWFDVENTNKVDSRIVESLESSKPIELSTGLYTRNERAEDGAVHNGKAYDFIAREYKPDHVAVLPDQIGACSIEDGCGVLVNKKSCKCPKGSSENCTCPVRNEKGEVNFTLSTNDISHSVLHDLLSKQLKTQFTQDEPSAWVSEVFDSYFIYWQGDDLFRLSYTNSGGAVSLGSETPQKVVRETSFVTVANEENSMSDKKGSIDQLIENCTCWNEKDREVLNNLSVEKLEELLANAKKIKEQEEVVNTATKALSDGLTVEGGSKYTFNTTRGEWTKEEQKKTPVTTNEQTPQTEEEWLAKAPAGIQSAVQNAMRIESREKEDLIAKITANVAEEKKEGLVQRLADKSLTELQDYAAIASISKSAKSVQTNNSIASYIGVAGGATSSQESHTEEPLPLPTINWGEEASN